MGTLKVEGVHVGGYFSEYELCYRTPTLSCSELFILLLMHSIRTWYQVQCSRLIINSVVSCYFSG